MKKYYEIPTQVVFVDFDNLENYQVGIAYQDKIICACCGGVFEIEELYELAKDEGLEEVVYPYASWIDISEEIKGGELPKGAPENII